MAWRRTSQHTLRISIQEIDGSIGVTLEGRLAGPWVAELDRAWRETAAKLGGRKLSLDLRSVTYTDAAGKRVLREIYQRTHAELLTDSAWTQYLAEEIRNSMQAQPRAEEA